VRERVKREVFKGGEAKGQHRVGSEGAALVVRCVLLTGVAPFVCLVLPTGVLHAFCDVLFVPGAPHWCVACAQ